MRSSARSKPAPRPLERAAGATTATQPSASAALSEGGSLSSYTPRTPAAASRACSPTPPEEGGNSACWYSPSGMATWYKCAASRPPGRLRFTTGPKP